MNVLSNLLEEIGCEKPIWKAKNHITKIPKNKKTNCHIHIDGKLNGAQVAGMFGSENKVLPIIAKGPNPNKNQNMTRQYAKGTNFFFDAGTPATSDKNACLFSLSKFFWSLSGKK